MSSSNPTKPLVESTELLQGRRTNAERTAQTQRGLMEATIDCLFRLGYGATTTHVVAEAAGLSRGAMVHHYPTKVDLMVAAVRFAWEKEMAEMHAELEKFELGLPRFRAVIDVHWALVQRPEDTAIHEVRNGSRSDPQLADAMHPIMAEIARDYAQCVGILIRQAGLEPDDELRGLTVNWVLALPMMAFYRAADPNRRMEESILVTLKSHQEFLIARQQGRAA
ncbi:MAG TPA: TetR/AcrR family transcriptional regulator [Steroidobacteraceae bacterium]|nr:TetR/AcrR family transcriptional regulator [Steroidobacteraceae bacterium]